MATIKCGREVYELADGDTIMDNGACLQLITRKVQKRWHLESPRVSKKAFAEFKANRHVGINNGEGDFPSYVTLWTYVKPADTEGAEND